MACKLIQPPATFPFAAPIPARPGPRRITSGTFRNAVCEPESFLQSKMALKAVPAIAAAVFMLAYSASMTSAAEIKTKVKSQAARLSTRNRVPQGRMAEIHKRLVERKIASRDALEQLLVAEEKKLASESADYAIKKRDYQRNLLSESELARGAQALSRTRAEIERLRQWIAEDDAALALAGYVRREQQERVPQAVRGNLLVTSAFVRYDGLADWSLEQAGKISKFFLDHFGYTMPISAMGQSPTHDRMGLDHREAMDVAVQPDSPEGQGLMAYLRKAGIPFIAFRNRVRGMATGAHIHIGRPSLRLVHAPEMLVSPHQSEKSHDG